MQTILPANLSLECLLGSWMLISTVVASRVATVDTRGVEVIVSFVHTEAYNSKDALLRCPATEWRAGMPKTGGRAAVSPQRGRQSAATRRVGA